MDRSDFAALPLDAQLDHLGQALPGSDARALLDLCAAVRDPAPLAWLARRLLDDGRLSAPAERASFTTFLIEQPETAVHKCLRALLEPLPEGHAQADLAAALLEALRIVPLARLATLCLIDRALKRHFAEARDAWVDDVVRHTERALRAGRAEDLKLDRLAHVPGAALASLRAIAAAAGAGTLAAFDTARARLASEAIAVLGAAPKAVSQANAEDLLARRVYTDPGHFLIELLQNAEDAAARTWRVIFDRTHILVWHDGHPFDVHDLVGVCSIGQTTKRKQQIGFFGVGFKSVYEITERPRVYSDAYRFEIADVSIPKELGARPADLPDGGTALVLPLRRGLDASRTPAALFRKAAALDPCVLLTLRSIATIDLELTPAAGGPARRTLREGVRDECATIHCEPEGTDAAFRVRDDEFQFDVAGREAGRPDRTRVMVGVRVDPLTGVPRALDPESATVYSYLPTREHSGLRFFVQGHFDVPVDRERIAPDSAWNARILAQVPLQLARVAQAVATANPGPAAALGLLAVLPIERELTAPVYRPVTQGLRAALADIACVPAADGRLYAPKDVLVASPALAALLGATEIGGRLRLLDPAADERTRELVLALGGARFGASELLALLEQQLGALPDGAPAQLAPPFLAAPEAWDRLRDLLLEEAEQRERAGDTVGLARWMGNLQALPLLLDDAGGLRRARPTHGEPPLRGTPAMREIYRGLRAFVAPRLEAGSPRDQALLDRLGVPTADPERLVADLQQALAGAPVPLSGPEAVAFPGSAERLERVLEVLCDASRALQKAAARLPLFRASDGTLWPAARKADDLAGVLAIPADDVGPVLAEAYGARRPLCAGTPAGAALLDRIGAQRLSLEVLTHDLDRDPPILPTDHRGLRALHALLEKLEDDLPDRARKLLARRSIWPDEAGVGRPLIGAAAVRIPEWDDVCTLYPEVAFLDREVRARAHVLRMDVRPVGIQEVLSGLAPRARGALRLAREPVTLDRALRFLLAHAAEIGAEGREALRTLPIFLSDRGAALPLSTLSRTVSPSLRAVYGDCPERCFLDPTGTSFALIHALGLGAEVKEVTAAVLIEDLAGPCGAGLAAQGDALLAVLAAAAPTLPRALAEQCAGLPIFPDGGRRCGSLGDPRREFSAEAVYAARPDLRPILAALHVRLLPPDVADTVAPLRVAAGIPEAGIALLLDAGREAAVDSGNEAALDALQRLLVEERATLSELCPVESRPGEEPSSPRLSDLRIWRTAGGSVVRGRDIADTEPLLPLIPAGSPARDVLDRARLEGATAERFRALAPMLAARPAAAVLAELMRESAKPGESLERQPAFLNTVERVSAVRRQLAEDGTRRGKTSVVPPLVDALGRLRFDRLWIADAETQALLAGLPLARDLLHPGMAAAWVDEPHSGLKPLPPASVIAALAPGMDAPRSVRFFAWLITHEAEVFAERSCREALMRAAVFPTERGTRVPPAGLILDAELPAVEIDGRPAKIIPPGLLDLLARHLGIGRPQIEELIREHLLPAYDEKLGAGRLDEAAEILGYFARRLHGRAAADVRELLCPGDRPLLLEDECGRPRSPAELILPAPELEAAVRAVWDHAYPRPAQGRYGAALRSFLLDLGVPALPTLERVRDALEHPRPGVAASAGLAAVVVRLAREPGRALIEALPLRQSAWVADGTGCLRRPAELYRGSGELEALIGNDPELYAHESVAALLGIELARELGFRAVTDVRAEEVLRHVTSRSATGKPVALRVYTWFDRALAQGRIEAAWLRDRLEQQAWVQCDDGAYFPARRVLGVRALHLFGRRRGYWEWGAASCPKLCEVFGIARELRPVDLLTFLREVAAEGRADAGRALLVREPALRRMLLAGYALLAEAGSDVGRDLPVVVAHPASRQGGPALLAAAEPTLCRSDTPDLEALFRDLPSLHFAERGTGEDALAVDRFHAALGIRRLRDAYRVVAATEAGKDRTAERGAQIQGLRATIRSLLAVLPRVRRGRAQPDSAWVYDARLRPLAASGGIRAIERLRVKYVLDEVGEVVAEASAAYDPERGELLVDTGVFDAPEAHSTGLAQALQRAILQSAGDDPLGDLLEILISLGTRERMDAYLGRRHFPAALSERSLLDRIADRIGEVLDFGLDRALATRFPALGGRDFSGWRDPKLLRQVAGFADESTADPNGLAQRTARLLLGAAGLADPPAEALDALVHVLLAPSLSDIPADLLGNTPATPEPAADSAGTTASAGAGIAAGAASQSGRIAPVAGAAIASPAVDAASPAGQPSNASGAPGTGSAGGEAPAPARIDGSSEPNAAATGDRSPGLWGRVKSWFGIDAGGDAATVPAALPEWAGSNSFPAAEGVPPQLWATPERRRELAEKTPSTRLAFCPSPLPSPYLYAVHTVGVAFNPASQAWSVAGAPRTGLLDPGTPAGRTVVFTGSVLPGESCLPVPLYGRVRPAPRIEGGELISHSSGTMGSLRVTVRGSAPITVRYEVELATAPAITAPGGRPFETHPSFIEPTLSYGMLHEEVRQFLAEQIAHPRPAWERATAVREFVRSHYDYDDGFLNRPEVRRQQRRLIPGVGNHHLLLLHASAAAGKLGRGICYELNVMVVELLRHLGIPCLVAGGWLLNESMVDRPDHLFALAILPSSEGPCVMPLDATAGVEGPVRPLGPRLPHRIPAGPATQDPAPVPAVGGPWRQGPPDRGESLKDAEIRRLGEAALHLTAAIRLARAVQRLPASPAPQPDPAHLAELRHEVDRLLGDPAIVSALLALLRGEFRQVNSIPPEVQELVRRGLARVHTVPTYQVVPVEPEGR